MANLRALRTRIASVKSTRKITSAMKVVAAARLRQSQERLSESSYFAASIGRMILRLERTIDYLRKKDISAGKKPKYEIPRLLVGTGEEQKHLVIVFSSSRGLCGGFNINVVKKAKRLINYLERKGKKVKLICVGIRAYDMLKHEYEDRIIERYDSTSNSHEQREDAEKISIHILDLYAAGKIDACSVVYNTFHSAISQEVRIDALIPLEPLRIIQPFTGGNPWEFRESEEIYKIRRPLSQKRGSMNRGKGGLPTPFYQAAKNAPKPQYRSNKVVQALEADADELKKIKDPLEYDFEPSSPAEVLEGLLPELLATLIYRSSLESSTSEFGARMTAMDNATHNADDIIDNLTLTYNRTRQGLITKELTEIISGAEAV